VYIPVAHISSSVDLLALLLCCVTRHKRKYSFPVCYTVYQSFRIIIIAFVVVDLLTVYHIQCM